MTLRDTLLQSLIPRRLAAGPLMLELIHRDGHAHGRWLALHPREFALLWRLAEAGGAPVPRAVILADVWRLRHMPETNSLAVHVARIRRKLDAAGLVGLLATAACGAYRLDGPIFVPLGPPSGLDRRPGLED